MWSGLGSPVSCWKDQEPHYREALWAAGKNRKHSLPAPRPPPHHSACEVNLGWLFIDRDSMGSPPSISTEYQLPSDLVSTHWESLVLLGLTQWEVWKLILFKQKEEKDCPAPPHLRQLCHCLTDQVGQELIWLSCSGLEVVSSHRLWDVLTEEGLSQERAVMNSRGTPSYTRVHAIWTPPILIFWGIHYEFGTGSKFPELEILFGLNLVTFASQQIIPATPSVDGNKSKTTSKVWGTKYLPYGKIAH